MTIYEMNLKVGNDNGNSEHDIIIDGKLIRQPNVFAKVRNLPNLDEVKEEYIVRHIEDNLITSIISPSINNGASGTYFIGNYARKSGRMLNNIEVGAFNSKVDSDVPVINTLSQIAGYCVQKAYKNNPEIRKIKANVDMTTALPVTQYSKDNATKFANKFMGRHIVTVHISTKTVDVEINFDYVKVLPESVPVVFYLQGLSKGNAIFNEFDKIYSIEADGEFFKNKRILHIAIGEGTTEYPLTEDIRFNPNFIQGSNNGVGHAINAVLNEFIQKKKLIKFSRQDFSAVLRDMSHKYYSDAMEMIEVHLEEQAETILRYAKNEVAKANNEVDIICVHGGGSILMKEFLYSKLSEFGQATDIKVFYAPENVAVTLEAYGMYSFTNSKIFDALKSKYKEVAVSK